MNSCFDRTIVMMIKKLRKGWRGVVKGDKNASLLWRGRRLSGRQVMPPHQVQKTNGFEAPKRRLPIHETWQRSQDAVTPYRHLHSFFVPLFEILIVSRLYIFKTVILLFGSILTKKNVKFINISLQFLHSIQFITYIIFIIVYNNCFHNLHKFILLINIYFDSQTLIGRINNIQ